MTEYDIGADAETLPPTWKPERDERPCDRCPADADRVLHRGGREFALCSSCYRAVVLGR